MNEEEIKDLFDAIDNRLILYQATNQIPNIDFDRLVKLSVAYEQLQQENQQLKKQVEKLQSSLEYEKENLKISKDYAKCLEDKLKQRDEVIDDIRNKVEEYVTKKRIETNSIKQFERYMELPIIIRGILNKYKGDNNDY